jgi:peptidoglycan/LPS O-acetylase OafA/YrhL
MFLSGALLALFMTGFWFYCLTDAILTPAPECRGLSKPTWIAVIAVTFIGGALAWLIVRRPVRDSVRPTPGWDHERPGDQGDLAGERWTTADDAAARHPAGRAMVTDPQAEPKGPDDDQEFLRALDRAIHGNRRAGGEA